MKNRVGLIVICLLLTFTGCSIKKEENKETQKRLLKPTQVIENYFKYYDGKNEKAMLTTLTEYYNSPNTNWDFDNLEGIKAISIEEESDPTQKEGYIHNGRGKVNGVKEENVKVYRVEFEVKYKKEGVGPRDSGKYTQWFFLIREDKTSPWLIDCMGV